MAMAAGKQRIQELFEKFDTSGDGTLQLDEMAEVFDALKFKNSWGLIRKIDKSGDELIQVHEFISWLFSTPPRYTIDKKEADGKEVVDVMFYNDFKDEGKCFTVTFTNCQNVEFLEGNPCSFVLAPGEIVSKSVLRQKEPGPSKYNLRVHCKGAYTGEEDAKDPFIDPEFPPEEVSIDPSGSFSKLDRPELWVRARILGSPISCCLFDQIHPEAIRQGGLGDCWLMGSLASLARYPKRIKSLFDTKQLSEDGKYSVWLFDIESEKWIKVVIDEFLPCKLLRDKVPRPQMSEPLGDEIWVALLEKAVAKYCGSFVALWGGQANWAFRLLTGETSGFTYRRMSAGWSKMKIVTKHNPRCPRPRWSWSKEKYRSDDELWECLLQHAQDQHVLACHMLPKGSLKLGDITDTGIVVCHLYSILQVLAETLDDGTPVRLMEVRNPWAGTEWNGDWCDWGKGGRTGQENASEKWTQNPKLKERIASHVGYDGASFMAYEDWVKIFDHVDLCPVGTAPVVEDDEGEQEEGDLDE